MGRENKKIYDSYQCKNVGKIAPNMGATCSTHSNTSFSSTNSANLSAGPVLRSCRCFRLVANAANEFDKACNPGADSVSSDGKNLPRSCSSSSLSSSPSGTILFSPLASFKKAAAKLNRYPKLMNSVGLI